MKKKILAITLSLCLVASTAFAGFGDSGAFGAMGNYLKRVGTNVLPAVTATYNLGSASKTWATVYAAAMSVTNFVVTGSIDWSGGNVVYVPIGGSIADAITAASVGDTLQLAAGTYTITAGLTVNKKLHIKGMGRGITTITCATKNIEPITFTTTDGSILSELTVASSGTFDSGTVHHMVTGSASYDIYNVSFIDTRVASGTRYMMGVGQVGTNKTTNIYNSYYTGSGAAICHAFFYVATAASTINAYYCEGVSADGTSATFGNNLVILTTASNGVINLYGGKYSSATNVASGVVYAALGVINVYGATINGSGATAFDVKRDAGTLTLHAGTELVNGTTSGTITYAGTVVANELGLNCDPSYKLSVGSADGTDQVGIYHDNTDAFMKWSDGYLYLMSDEGTNTDSNVFIKGKGTGDALLAIWDGSNANYISYFKQDENIFALNFYSAVTEFVINDGGTDVDFRVESDNKANAILLDAGTDTLKIDAGFTGTPDGITATSEGVAASLKTMCTEITSNGDSDLDNVTLANGTSGQIKHFVWTVAGNAADTLKITPATTCGAWTQITFDANAVGNGCTMIYCDNEGWAVIGNNGGTIA